jgi:cytochrome b561
VGKWARDRVFAHSIREVHETLSNILVILATFHAVAAVVHHFVWRDRALERMLPLLALVVDLSGSVRGAS